MRDCKGEADGGQNSRTIYKQFRSWQLDLDLTIGSFRNLAQFIRARFLNEPIARLQAGASPGAYPNLCKPWDSKKKGQLTL